jgi:hypothetical protein
MLQLRRNRNQINQEKTHTMKCPSCNKFCGLEMQDPENQNIEFDAADLDSITLSVEVRILRNSECCGDEIKEYTFNTDAEIDDDLVEKMKAIRATDPDVEFEANEGQLEALEESGGRYKKSFYGFNMTVEIGYSKPTTQRTADEAAEFEKLNAALAVINKANSERYDFNAPRDIEPDADRARRIALSNIGRPTFESLGCVEISDKVAASEMDELN